MSARSLPKRSRHELKRIIEDVVNSECSLPRRGLWFVVDELQADGAEPLRRIQAWGTLHFTSGGSPFCCGEPDCHLRPMDERDALIADGVRRALSLIHAISIDLKIAPVYHDGVEFGHG